MNEIFLLHYNSQWQNRSVTEANERVQPEATYLWYGTFYEMALNSLDFRMSPTLRESVVSVQSVQRNLVFIPILKLLIE